MTTGVTDTFRALYDFVMEHQHVFNAPYGVLAVESSHPRRMTFGIARTLDASLEVYGPKFIRLKTSRSASQVFKSVDEALAYMRTNFLLE
jgi:hypothetical protein